MWSAEVLEVNPSCDVTAQHIGPANHKVLLADIFYRHRPTGLPRVPIGMTAGLETLAQQYGCSAHAIRTHDGYGEFINRVFFRPEFAAKENAYINDGNDYWELLYRIDMKPNRLVIFDGRMFHSQHIAPTQFRDYFRMNQILNLQGHD